MDDHKFISELFKSDNVSYFKSNYLYFHVSNLLGLILIISPIVYIIIRLLNNCSILYLSFALQEKNKLIRKHAYMRYHVCRNYIDMFI